jgi:hypothetical protein
MYVGIGFGYELLLRRRNRGHRSAYHLIVPIIWLLVGIAVVVATLAWTHGI